MRRFERLIMTMSLLDRVSPPIRGIMRTITRLQRHVRSAFSDIGKGMATITGTAALTTATLFPSGDLYAAVGEVRSLGVGEAGLKSLRHEGGRFAAAWGVDSANFVRSAYDIQSAIAGLSERELPSATRTAGILAKATKANIEDMTSFFGSMYGIFQTQADEVGKARWLEDLAGKTAAAVEMFKTTGPAMQQAFQSLGNGAANAGISLDNQIAILGTLQSSGIDPGAAGTAFNAFIRGLSARAGEKLGLEFQDAQGKMLPVLTILERIQNEFGNLNTLAAKGAVGGAFGDEGLRFIETLIVKKKVLSDNMDNIASKTGLTKAIKMAEAMTMPWDRILLGSKALMASVGFDSIKSAVPILNNIADRIGIMVKWSQQFPHLNKKIADTIALVAGLGIALGAMWIGVGVVKLLALAFTPLKIILLPIVGLYKLLRIGWIGYVLAKQMGLGILATTRLMMTMMTAQVYATIAANKFLRISVFLLKAPFIALSFAGGKLIKVLQFMRLALLTSLPAILSFSAALWANPITWVVAGIFAAGAALYFLITRWDAVVNAFRQNEWMKTLFFPLYLGIELIDLIVKNFNRIPELFAQFKQWFSQLDLFEALHKGFDIAIDKLNLLPGVNIALSRDEHQQELKAALPTLNTEHNFQQPDKGGLMQQFINNTQNSNKGHHVEKIEVHNHGKGTNAHDLAYHMEMNAG